MSPKANLNLRWVSVSVYVGAGTMWAVLGGIQLLVSICLIVGADRVSDAFTVSSTLGHFPTKESILGCHCEAARSRFEPGNRIP